MIAAAAVLAVVLIGNGVRQQQLQARTQQLAEEYAANMEAASQTMLLGAIDAENTGNLIKSVWYNSIYEERDSETDKYTRPNGYFVSDFNDADSEMANRYDTMSLYLND